MKKSKPLLILALVVVLALGVLVSCKGECTHENYGAWSLTKAPTLTDAGEAVRVCADCGVAETTTVAKLSDTSVWTPATTNATHTAAGKTTYTSTYGTVTINIDRLTDHVYDKEVATEAFLASAADCTHAAVYRKSCVCGAVGTATFTSGNALGHDGKAVAAVPAVHNDAEIKDGTAVHYKCDRCGKLFSDEACTTEVTAASLVVTAAHNYDGWVLVADATCTTDGSIIHRCATCGKVETNVLPAHDHVYTSGKVVVVTSRDVYQDDDGEIIEGDEEATQFHAPVCDVCKVINKDAKVAHVYGDEYLIVREVPYGQSTLHEVLRRHKCNACGHVEATGNHTMSGVIDSLGYLDSTQSLWTAGKTVAPTYTSDGYTEYTQGNYKVNLVLPKLIAPYEGNTYRPLRVEPKSDDAVAGLGKAETAWINALLTLDDKGQGKGGGSPYNGNVTMTFNPATNAVTMKVARSESDVTTLNGYIEPSTGIMIIEDSSAGFAKPYIITPYNWTSTSSVTASHWLNGMAINYHIDCGTYTGHDIAILVNDGVVTFGVTFEDATGAIVAAEDCYTKDLLIAKSGNDVIATFVKNSDGVLQAADEYRGEYTATGSATGTLVVDGIGGFVLDGTIHGVYSATATENVFDAYVIVNGKKVEHHVATMDVANHTATLAASKVAVTFVPGSQGTVTPATQDVFTNCEITVVPTTSDYIFIGWFDKDGTDDDWGNQVTSVSSAATLYAKYTQEVTITVVNTLEGDKTLTIVMSEYVVDQIEVVLNYTNTTVNVTNNTLFGGWYTDATCTNKLDPEASVTPDNVNDIQNIYVKWIPAGAWTVDTTAANTFYYDSNDNTWKNDNKGQNSTTSLMEIVAHGTIVVSFDYWCSSESATQYDYLTIWYYNLEGKWVSVTAGGTSSTASDAKTITTILQDGQKVRFSYCKDSSGDGGSQDTAFIVNLTINGVAETKSGTRDFKEGTYTCAGQDDIVLDGYGAFTWGTKEGTYTVNDDKLALIVVEDGNSVAGYEVTLVDSTFTFTTLKVTVTMHYGENGWNNIDTVGTTGTTPQAEEVDIFSLFTLPTTAPSYEGYEFIGWYDARNNGNVLTEITPGADVDVYGRYVPTIEVTYNDTVNNIVNHKVVAHKNVALGDKLLTLEITTDGDRIFVGWFTKDATGDDWGTEITSASTLSANTTLYARWEVPHALMGTYKGWEAYSGRWYSSTAMKTLTVKADGTVSGDFSGTITGYDAATGNFTIVNNSSSRVGFYDSASNNMMIGFGASDATLGNDVYVLLGDNDPMPKNYSEAAYTASWKSEGSSFADNYVLFTITNEGTADEQTHFIYRNGGKIYGNVTVKVNGAPATKATMNNIMTAGNVLAVTLNDVEMFKGKYDGTAFVTTASSEKGTYTGTIGTASSITLDGFGLATIGDDIVFYTIDDSKITVILNNRMMIIELGDGTCAQVQDGIAGTYTLPDDAGTIVLDGLGGAGNGATYVVNGGNITVYTADGSTTYGLDVTNKKLAGKSIFAGMTFRNGNSTVHYVTFEDGVDITGTFYMGNAGWWVKFTGELTGDTLTLTVDSQQGTGASKGATIVITVSNNTLTVVSPNGFDFADFASNKTYTCADFTFSA